MSCAGKTGDALAKCRKYEALKKRYENFNAKKDTILVSKSNNQKGNDLKLRMRKAKAAEALALKEQKIKKQKPNTTRKLTYNTKGSANEDKKVTQNKKTKVYTSTIKVNKKELANTIVKKSIKVKDTKKEVKKTKPKVKVKTTLKPKGITKTKPKVIATPKPKVVTKTKTKPKVLTKRELSDRNKADKKASKERAKARRRSRRKGLDRNAIN